MNNMIRALSASGTVVICALNSTEIVREMEKIHQTSAEVSAALGRLLTGASLMGSWLKHPQDSLTLRVDGGGPAGVLVAVSDGEGNVRGYAANPLADAPLRADGKLNVGGVVGDDGTLSVIKDLGLKEPYIGQTPLESGEIAEDITAYYAASEQTPSICALGVLVNPDLTIRQAGGFLLQLLPGATEEEISQVEANVQKMPSVTQLLDDGADIDELVQRALAGMEPQVMERCRVEYRCYRSEEKTRDILASLGADELREMLKEGPDAEVQCHFCNKYYTFDIETLLDGLTAKKDTQVPS